TPCATVNRGATVTAAPAALAPRRKPANCCPGLWRERGIDPGIRGKRAPVCAPTRGCRSACAATQAAAGVDLVMNARGAEALEGAAAAIRAAHGVRVTAIATDVTTDEGRGALLEAAGDIDILVTNAGGPPPGMWTDWDREDFIRALDANMLTPIALMKALLPGMIARGWGRVVN